MLLKKIYLNYVDEDDEEKTWCVDPVYVEDCEMQNRRNTQTSRKFGITRRKSQRKGNY